ncbi:molybdopterin cofactor-binding domain-containing protein [Chelatococcus sp.]|uniref:molybdopterin cofactor-binding domain-containing protein n=1 Tax=Chelatococcus sp. TaxID=1953771 RepID=UPI0025B9BFD3|nr:molybdopterin cofactor-binding domain-containing protein [Chelatococcus sp.]
MGIGQALTEETLFDERTGRIMDPSMAEYHIPVHADVPPIEVLWTGIRPHEPVARDQRDRHLGRRRGDC